MLTGTQARAIRFKLGLTQKDMAELLELPATTWSNIEVGNSPMQPYMEVRFIQLMESLGVVESDKFSDYLAELSSDELNKARIRWQHVPGTREIGRLQSASTLDNEEDVTRPTHYHQGGIDVIEYARMKLPKEQLIGFFRINIMKYLMRYDHKNGVEDLIKMQDYADLLIKEVQGE